MRKTGLSCKDIILFDKECINLRNKIISNFPERTEEQWCSYLEAMRELFESGYITEE